MLENAVLINRNNWQHVLQGFTPIVPRRSKGKEGNTGGIRHGRKRAGVGKSYQEGKKSSAYDTAKARKPPYIVPMYKSIEKSKRTVIYTLIDGCVPSL